MDRLVKLSPANITCAGSCLDMVVSTPLLFEHVPEPDRECVKQTLALFRQLHEENKILAEGSR